MSLVLFSKMKKHFLKLIHERKQQWLKISKVNKWISNIWTFSFHTGEKQLCPLGIVVSIITFSSGSRFLPDGKTDSFPLFCWVSVGTTVCLKKKQTIDESHHLKAVDPFSELYNPIHFILIRLIWQTCINHARSLTKG